MEMVKYILIIEKCYLKKIDKPKKKIVKAIDMEVNHKKEVDNGEKSL